LLADESYRHKVGSIELLTSIELVVSTPLRAGGILKKASKKNRRPGEKLLFVEKGRTYEWN
jgi:hypothetical protein